MKLFPVLLTLMLITPQVLNGQSAYWAGLGVEAHRLTRIGTEAKANRSGAIASVEYHRDSGGIRRIRAAFLPSSAETPGRFYVSAGMMAPFLTTETVRPGIWLSLGVHHLSADRMLDTCRQRAGCSSDDIVHEPGWSTFMGSGAEVRYLMFPTMSVDASAGFQAGFSGVPSQYSRSCSHEGFDLDPVIAVVV